MSTTIVLHNADVRTMDGRVPHASSVLVRGDRIVAAGRDNEIRAAAGSRYDAVDCRGDVILPAFIDAHVHLLSYAASLRSVDCSPEAVSDIGTLLARLRERARRTPAGEWIRATGYRETELAEMRHPTRWELDAAAPNHPVRLIHGSGHGSVLNSAALALVGISVASDEPRGGYIGRRIEDGEPDGLLLEMNEVIERRVPPLPWDELRNAVTVANETLLRAGVTSVHDLGPANDTSTLTLFQRLRDSGALNLDLVPAIGIEAFRKEFRPRDWTGMVKLIVSELGEHVEPSLAELATLVREVHDAGARAVVHAISARAVTRALDAFERVAGEGTVAARRHRIEHAAICPPALRARMARLGLIAVCNPGFLFDGGDRYLRTVTSAELPYLHSIGALADDGILIAAGSDAPISLPDPLGSIRAAVLRRTRSGRRVPGQALDLERALRAHTCNAAFAGGQENLRGTIAPGKVADLIRIQRAAFEFDDDYPAAILQCMHNGEWCEAKQWTTRGSCASF